MVPRQGILARTRPPLLFLVALIVVDALVRRGVIPNPSALLPTIAGYYQRFGPWPLGLIAFGENLVGFTYWFPGSVAILAGMAAAWGSPRSVLTAFAMIYVGGLAGLMATYAAGMIARGRNSQPADKGQAAELSQPTIWATLLAYCHPHSATTLTYTAASEGVPLKRFLRIAVPTLAAWYVVWTLATPLIRVAVQDWSGFRPVLYAYGIIWLAWNAGRLESLRYSATGRSRSVPTRPHLTDAARARVVGSSNLGALLMTAGVYQTCLRNYYEPWVTSAVHTIEIAQGAVALLCFGLAASVNPIANWQEFQAGIVGEASFRRTDTRITGIVLRVIVAATVLWIGALTYVTGGLVGSPFAPLGVTVIVLGQFLASTTETQEALVIVGLGFYAILEFLLPLVVQLPTMVAADHIGSESFERRWAYFLVTTLGILLGFYARSQSNQAEAIGSKKLGERES